MTSMEEVYYLTLVYIQNSCFATSRETGVNNVELYILLLVQYKKVLATQN